MVICGQKGRDMLNNDEKLDLILEKLAAMEKRIDKVENKPINVNIVSDPVVEARNADSRFNWMIGIFGVIGFIVLYNVIIILFDSNSNPQDLQRNQIISLMFSLLLTGVFCYTAYMNRKERKERSEASK